MDYPGHDARPLGGRRAVLVDDDRQLLNVMRSLLQDAGCDVIAFDHFSDAKKHLTTDASPDILITDVRLGAFNGLQLALMARLEHPEMTTIVMTGYDDPVLRRDAERAGAVYLVKPVSPESLIDALRARP